MTTKVHIGKIISHHNSTLSDDNGTPIFSDYGVFYLAPLLMALAWIYIDGRFSSSSISVIVTASSIFAGLMFSLLILTHERRLSIKKSKSSDSDFKTNSQKIKLTEETYYNISFSILISIFCTFMCITYVAINEIPAKGDLPIVIKNSSLELIGAGIVATIICTLASLMMVLKRSFSMFINMDREN